ncbi:MAG: SGNH/GDSL hydrolase family protein, partial [Cellulosilyticaceae bacterium]
YELIHINNGIHVHGVTPEVYKHNLKRIFQWIHLISPHTQIMFCNTTPFSKKGSGEAYWVFDPEASQILIELNDMAMQVCHGMHIPVNDLFKVCISENLQKSDGVHFQESGYLRLAECVVKSIGERLNTI